MKISKADIALYADFTTNIDTRKVDFQINDAGKMDVAPVITAERYNAIIDLPEDATGDTEEQTVLRGLYNALVPYWAMCAYKRIIAFHGVDVAQAGLVVNRDNEYEQISDKRRGEILGAIRSKVNYYQNELEKYMKDNSLTPVPDSCETPRSTGGFGVRVAKARYNY